MIMVRKILFLMLLCFQIADADQALMTFINNPQADTGIDMQGIYINCHDDLYKFLKNSPMEPVVWAHSSKSHYLVVSRNNEISVYRIHVGAKTVAIPCRFNLENGIASRIKPIEEFQGFYIPKAIFDVNSVSVFNFRHLTAAPTK